jgi:hypothetical protein
MVTCVLNSLANYTKKKNDYCPRGGGGGQGGGCFADKLGLQKTGTVQTDDVYPPIVPLSMLISVLHILCSQAANHVKTAH